MNHRREERIGGHGVKVIVRITLASNIDYIAVLDWIRAKFCPDRGDPKCTVCLLSNGMTPHDIPPIVQRIIGLANEIAGIFNTVPVVPINKKFTSNCLPGCVKLDVCSNGSCWSLPQERNYSLYVDLENLGICLPLEKFDT